MTMQKLKRQSERGAEVCRPERGGRDRPRYFGSVYINSTAQSVYCILHAISGYPPLQTGSGVSENCVLSNVSMHGKQCTVHGKQCTLKIAGSNPLLYTVLVLSVLRIRNDIFRIRIQL